MADLPLRMGASQLTEQHGTNSLKELKPQARLSAFPWISFTLSILSSQLYSTPQFHAASKATAQGSFSWAKQGKTKRAGRGRYEVAESTEVPDLHEVALGKAAAAPPIVDIKS